MAAKTTVKKGKNGLSGETRMFYGHFDGSDKYSQDIVVGLNGMKWQIKRGVWVEIPVEVYDIIMQSEEQDTKTAALIRELTAKAQESGAL